MSKFDYDLGIIGGGAAGLTVAAGASQLGAKTVLIEMEKELGGDCLHYGCVPSKTLIKSAHVYHQIKNAPDFGLPRVEVPPVDFREVSKRIRSVIATIQHHDSQERFCGLGTQVEFGPAEFNDEYTVMVNGKRYSAKNWVIATGSSPMSPPIPGLLETTHLTNREIFYIDHLPKSMIVLGAGPIGIEMSQAFNRFGTQVTVIDLADQILVKEDHDMAEEVMKVLEAEGLRFSIGSTIDSVNDLGSEKEVIVKDKSGASRSLKAESVLVALGRKPNIDGLGLENIGVEFDISIIS